MKNGEKYKMLNWNERFNRLTILLIMAETLPRQIYFTCKDEILVQ